MKNKKVLYLLIPLAAAIWGNFFYRLLGDKGGDEPGIAIVPSKKEAVTPAGTMDTFSIAADYGDPFLERNVIKSRRASSYGRFAPAKRQSKPKRKKPEKRPVVVKWPEVRYNGLIKGRDKNVGLLVIGKQNRLMSVEDEAGEVKVLNLYPDSVELEYKGEKRMIRSRLVVR